jgi:hypothetical protein
MYCVEAAEAWFEDVGKGTLVGGKATIALDPAFAQHIETQDYHVFLTEYGGSSGLYVDKQTASGFEVHASGGSGGGTFSWRVVGKRADMAGERLAKFVMPPGLKVPETPLAPPVSTGPQPAPPARPASTSTSAAGTAAGTTAGIGGKNAPSATVQPAPPARP